MWNCRMPGCCRAIWRPKEENQKSTFFLQITETFDCQGESGSLLKIGRVQINTYMQMTENFDC